MTMASEVHLHTNISLSRLESAPVVRESAARLTSPAATSAASAAFSYVNPMALSCSTQLLSLNLHMRDFQHPAAVCIPCLHKVMGALISLTAADSTVGSFRSLLAGLGDLVSSKGKQWAHCLIASRASAEKILGAGAVAALNTNAGAFFSPLHREFHVADSFKGIAISKLPISLQADAALEVAQCANVVLNITQIGLLIEVGWLSSDSSTDLAAIWRCFRSSAPCARLQLGSVQFPVS